jgi:phospholipid/cholesterol/gamma-HCH transport system substrate-binding protein
MITDLSRAEVRRRQLLGIVLIAVLGLLSALVVAGYTQAFTPFVAVTVRAERAGLLMSPGADVTVRGMSVGKVRSVALVGGDAVLGVDLYEDDATRIPANVTATIVAPTVFGSKYVALEAPEHPSPVPVSDGAVIPASRIGLEANDLLGNVHTLLTRVDVAKLSSALGALSTSLNGRGQELGTVLASLNNYLRGLNPSLPALSADVAGASDVLRTYADVSPQLAHTLDNLAVTSKTVIDEKQALPPLLGSLIRTSDRTRTLVSKNGGPLLDTLRTLRPTSELLGHYSPMFPCLFGSFDQIRVQLEHAIGYRYPGIHLYTQELPGIQGYQYPRDLPKVIPPTAPSCFGGPLAPKDSPSPYVKFDDGWRGFERSDRLTLDPFTAPLAKPLPAPFRGGPGR